MPTIDVVHDYICPWCRVGSYYLEQALAKWDGPRPTVRVHPYQLNPGVSDAGINYHRYLAEKFGDARIKTMHGRLIQLGEQIGLPFNFDKIEVLPNTARAHAMTAAVPVEKQWPLMRAIEEAHFLNGADIGSAEVLAAIGVTSGLSAEEARTAAFDCDLQGAKDEARSASDGGITGVPTFVFDGRLPLVGAQPPEALLSALSRVAG